MGRLASPLAAALAHHLNALDLFLQLNSINNTNVSPVSGSASRMSWIEALSPTYRLLFISPGLPHI